MIPRLNSSVLHRFTRTILLSVWLTVAVFKKVNTNIFLAENLTRYCDCVIIKSRYEAMLISEFEAVKNFCRERDIPFNCLFRGSKYAAYRLNAGVSVFTIFKELK